ncbi:conserved hypothetical membrane protein [Parvibaculum lavamentivorans DS-1]|uniref:Conserved hypothetical membrane protein n=1 Tax=Parvibaculum lavamentivorans (strain DS-1 / DSM 13023 / NCIMB 13966) TaxID=402881 RepID=A7HVB3_PARL1|nr:DUF4159 domain-containing protein [Parvibaculum lavamentivorans]ABS63846.1 conserved hypothetical membrane protein [Parvibaculum lavamentivorans DS-1]
MLQLGPLAFASPWMLLGLAALPAIWWLLRISPPLPKRVRFPAIRLLVGLAREEETPAHTPFWLLLLRLLIAALIVFALAEPLWNPAPRIAGSGPLLIVTDNGWAAAAHWSERRTAMDGLIAEARRADRPVLVVGTAPEANAPELNFEAADDAAARARAMLPNPIEPDRIALIEKLEGGTTLASRNVQTVWISDGLDYGAAAQFGERLSALAGAGGLTLVEPKPMARALALLPPEDGGGALTATVVRALAGGAREGSVRAIGSEGGVVSEAPFQFAGGDTRAAAIFELPLELRNRVARLEISGEASAGAVVLADERWRRRSLGIVSGAGAEEAQPLLSDVYYLRRALAPYVELRETGSGRNTSETIEELLASPLSVLVLADIGNLGEDDIARVREWVEAGGLLIRFAGPRLAEGSDDLVPVPLRSGGRALGGALSWSTPQNLAAFEEGSPFFGLEVPSDVTVSRQVLAEPAPDLAAATWARLSDGTPLVTAARRGNGTVILFHVTANRDWSNLPISGLFVEMLRRSVALSQGTPAAGEGAAGESGAAARERELLYPVATLDGFGRLGTPPATATAISAEQFGSAERSPRHPPGLYGTAANPQALNLATPSLELKAMPEMSGIAERRNFAGNAELRLAAFAFAIALLLVILDTVAALWVTGLFETEKIRRVRFGTRIAPVILAALFVLSAFDARAQDRNADRFALQASLETRLAYVITGDREIDETSAAGLAGLSQVLRARTAFEPGEPMGVDVTRDELAFFPVLYWPMSEGQQTLSPEVLGKINAYMKNGGTILFDTRDQGSAIGAAAPGTETLRRLLGRLDLPPIEPVPADHVLTKSFYLMHSFPGRWQGGQVWVEASLADAGNPANDGVSTIVVGSNDYAAAWARDARGRPLYPVSPGGERQREMADRFGVNLVIYALTGNYKADQVHVPALLERLGQ